MTKRLMTITFTAAPVSISISTGPCGILRVFFNIYEMINSLVPRVNIKAVAPGLLLISNTGAVTLS